MLCVGLESEWRQLARRRQNEKETSKTSVATTLVGSLPTPDRFLQLTSMSIPSPCSETWLLGFWNAPSRGDIMGWLAARRASISMASLSVPCFRGRCTSDGSIRLLVRHNAADYALGSASSYLSYLTFLWMGDFPALASGLMALDVRVARISSTVQSSSALRVGPEEAVYSDRPASSADPNPLSPGKTEMCQPRHLGSEDDIESF